MSELGIHIYEDMDSAEDTVTNQLNSSWLLSQCYLVFFMQAGFGMLETGMARAKNTKNIIIKNLLITAIGAITYWAVGYGIAFGRPKNFDSSSINGFIGTGNYFITNFRDFDFWMIQWTYSSTAVTIPTSAIMERASFFVYILHSVVMWAFIYPLLTHWIWSPDGFLYGLGVIDYGGGGVVHVAAGIVGLVGARLIGPRMGRFDSQTKEPMLLPPHNMTVSALGAFILWYSWYGYTSSSSYGITHGRWDLNARTAVVTTLCGATSMIVSVLIRRYQTCKFDLVVCIYGLMSGLVSITSVASVIDIYIAIVIGFVAGIVYVAWSTVLLRLKIDDPIDAISIHLGCGIWSMLSVGLFANPHDMTRVYGDRNVTYGIFFGKAGFYQFGVQLLAVVLILIFAGVCSLGMFYLLKRYHRLRIDPDTELAGLDNTNHGGSAYAF